MSRTRFILASAVAGSLVLGGLVLAGPPAGAAICLTCDGGDGGDPPPTTTPTTKPPTTVPSPTNTWAIDADSLSVITGQEQGILSNGDEFYIAQLGFRSTPGKAGSTSAFFQGGLTEVGGLATGQSRSIPDAQGRVVFPNVTTRTMDDVGKGLNPEVIGTLSVVFESDATPWSTINSMMANLAGTAKTEIAKVVEPLTLAGLLDPAAVADKLAVAKVNIQNAAMPTTMQAIGIFLGSFGDPDDLVAFRANVFVAVDGTMAPLVDSKFSSALPASTGVGGALRNRSYTQRFAGDGAAYDVNYVVNK
jgi:hypothetical protein